MSRVTARQFAALTKNLEVPKGGWNAHTFAAHGHQLISAIAYTARIVKLRATATLAHKAHSIFKRQLDEIISRAMYLAGHKGVKADVFIPVVMADQRHIWERAIAEALKDSGVEVTTQLMPPIQSVMAQGYSKVAVMLGSGGDAADVATQITRESRAIAQRIVGINNTTRERIMNIVNKGVQDGKTVAEVAHDLHDKVPSFNSARAMTVARTELSTAWTKGSVVALKDDGMVTHVSIIGCESREEDRWGQPSYQQFMYRGESTCNIKDVPIADADKLNFHPNHTGTMVPSSFMQDGSAPQGSGGGGPLGVARLLSDVAEILDL